MQVATPLRVIDSPSTNDFTKWRLGAMRGPHCINTKHLNSTKDKLWMQHVGVVFITARLLTMNENARINLKRGPAAIFVFLTFLIRRSSLLCDWLLGDIACQSNN